MYGRVSAWVAVVVVVGTVLVSGPLTGVDLTTGSAVSESPYCTASGNATVGVVDVPLESFRFEPKDYDAGPYYLASDPVIVSVSDVHGCPILVYRLRVPELGYHGNKLQFLGARKTTDESTVSATRNVSLSPVASNVRRDRIEGLDNETIRGVIRIELRGDYNRTVYRRNLSIPVKDD
jgi:hypothetical protein